MSEIKTADDVVQALGHLTIMEMIALTKNLEQKWGVEAKPLAVVMAPVVTDSKKEAQTEFTVILASVPAAAKMSTIKLVRELLVIGLKESKELVESVPKVVGESLTKDQANAMVEKLTAVGSVCEVK